MNNPNAIDNLKPFKKGNQMAKGHGRPPLSPIKDLIKQGGDELAEKALSALMEQVEAGNVQAIRLFFEYRDGKPGIDVNLKSENTSNILFEIIDVEEENVSETT